MFKLNWFEIEAKEGLSWSKNLQVGNTVASETPSIIFSEKLHSNQDRADEKIDPSSLKNLLGGKIMDSRRLSEIPSINSRGGQIEQR
uniref:Uncharacterized protein n=1 Tax=Ditylenchus dipsaci TaxID=166011 RepID=A0A915CQE8_9BILA